MFNFIDGADGVFIASRRVQFNYQGDKVLIALFHPYAGYNIMPHQNALIYHSFFFAHQLLNIDYFDDNCKNVCQFFNYCKWA